MKGPFTLPPTPRPAGQKLTPAQAIERLRAYLKGSEEEYHLVPGPDDYEALEVLDALVWEPRGDAMANLPYEEGQGDEIVKKP